MGTRPHEPWRARLGARQSVTRSPRPAPTSTRVCFKHGPPSRTGIELEWLLIDPHDPSRRPDAADACRRCSARTPRPPWTRTAPPRRCPHGGLVTVEPGGQLEISSAPGHLGRRPDRGDARATSQRCRPCSRPSGFELGDLAADPHRPPHRILHTPRYNAMAEAFDAVRPGRPGDDVLHRGPQVCVDLGTRAEAARPLAGRPPARTGAAGRLRQLAAHGRRAAPARRSPPGWRPGGSWIPAAAAAARRWTRPTTSSGCWTPRCWPGSAPDGAWRVRAAADAAPVGSNPASR